MERVIQTLSEACGRPFDLAALFDGNPYLSDAALREWAGYLMLRRAAEVPGLEVGMAHMRFMRQHIDKDRANGLFAEARKADPHLDAWLTERYVPRYGEHDFSRYAPGTFGGLVHQHVVQKNMKLDLTTPEMSGVTDFDFWMLRGLQTHDFEHILGGSQFNIVGEMLPHTMRYGFSFRYLPAELAGLLSTSLYLITISHLVSAMLHTPDVFPTLFGRIQRGWLIGHSSGPYFFARFEDYFALPIAEARQALDIRNIDEADTSAATDRLLAQTRAA
jgi:ubiquinone biosynthesis protein COQ4